MSYWAKPPCPREQLVLFATCLDDRIPDDHPVRLLAEILEGVDWSDWEAHYHGSIGQPPIHPRVLAALWLFALRQRIRSSRKVEYMAAHNIDFLWLAEGHTPDHTTLSEFRSRFKVELKGLFRQVANIAIAAGFLRLVDVATDGTRIKANNSRYETWKPETLARALDELTTEFEKLLAESQQRDGADDDGLGEGGSSQLPPELADLAERREKLQAIQQELQEATAARRREGIDPQKNPAQIPKHDPDSRVLPNKEGGYAPNYTPIATTEGHGGYIVDADVIVGPGEQGTLVPSLDRVTEMFGEQPENALADGAFATGPNIADLESRQIEFFSHLPTPPVNNPAQRDDPQQPVPADAWDQLPINPQTKTLDKSCFQYDEAQDVYHCPNGQPLEYEETKSETRRGERISFRVYRSQHCQGCALAGRCVSAKNQGGRTISRDVYQPQREEFAARMQTESAQQKYDQRMRIAETTFALIKQGLGLRQFLLRGLEKVKTEWLWTCTAVNLGKLMRDLGSLRARLAAAVAE